MSGESGTGRPHTRVLIVEDHPLVREALAAILATDGRFEICGSVGTSGEALELALASPPHLVLVDLRLSNGESGMTLIRELRAGCRETQIVVVSGQDPELYAEPAHRAGAAAFVEKRDVNERLLPTLRAIFP